MRRCFGKVISELADKDDDIYLIVGDIGYRHREGKDKIVGFIGPVDSEK